VAAVFPLDAVPHEEVPVAAAGLIRRHRRRNRHAKIGVMTTSGRE
jgi:hypothetical protein